VSRHWKRRERNKKEKSLYYTENSLYSPLCQPHLPALYFIESSQQHCQSFIIFLLCDEDHKVMHQLERFDQLIKIPITECKGAYL
jgi:hypothetical protein